jgi:hypothetical protein
MTGLMFDLFVFAVLFFGGSLAFLWIGALMELAKERRPRYVRSLGRLRPTPPPVDRLIWTGESWEDPRESLALEQCKARHPSNRNR